MITIVVAAAENNVIGKDGKIPWHLPNDMKHFKDVTMGTPIIMGRKTYDSIGKPLPGRRNIVVTRQEGLQIEGCDVVGSLEEAIETAQQEAEKVSIIGGGEIYRLSLPMADRIEITVVHGDFEGDAFFPEISADEWKMVSEEHHDIDEKNIYPYTFVTYDRV